MSSLDLLRALDSLAAREEARVMHQTA